MRKTREVLRLKLEAGLSNRLVGQSCHISPSTVWDVEARFKASGLSWPLPEEMDDLELERRLYAATEGPEPVSRALPDWSTVQKEMRRKHVTLMLLWQEYKAANPNGYQYSWFCETYHLYREGLDLVMRQDHKLGEKCFVDYAGDKMEVVDPDTGEVYPASLFVGVLGASNYTFVEATLKEDLPAWIGSHVRMFDFFGGCTEILVPDNLKCGVTKPNYYEPDINPTYLEMAEHYDVAVVPARVRRPKDKAKAENGVLIAERRIIAGLRNRIFFNIEELNLAIREKLDELNHRPFQKLVGSRQRIFEEEEKATLKPLPSCRYHYAQRKKATVHIDYHVELEGHYYSVPYTLARQPVEIRWTSNTVEILHQGKRVASHLRLFGRTPASTLTEHMPPRHRKLAEWTPERVVAWAQNNGPWTAQLVTEIMARRRHPEQGFRSCLGILRLSDKYGSSRLEAACHRAVSCQGFSYKTVKAILDHHLDQHKVEPAPEHPSPPCLHENIRGADYYN